MTSKLWHVYNASHLLFKTGDAGLWYRKHSSELTKSKKKKWRDKQKPADKSVEDSQGKPASQKEETATKKVGSMKLA